LRAAINHHHKEGFHREVVRVVLPERGEARQRWLERGELARLLWTCWRTREVQEGITTDKRPLRHLCRFLLLGIYNHMMNYLDISAHRSAQLFHSLHGRSRLKAA
jgi:hypothetical protein